MRQGYSEEDQQLVTRIIGVNDEINHLIGNLYFFLNNHDDSSYQNIWGDVQKQLQQIYPLTMMLEKVGQIVNAINLMITV